MAHAAHHHFDHDTMTHALVLSVCAGTASEEQRSGKRADTRAGDTALGWLATCDRAFLSQIFLTVGFTKHLFKVATVNQHWRAVTYAPELYLDMSSSSSSHYREYGWLRGLTNATALMKVLKQERFRLLEKLTFPKLRLGTTTFSSLAKNCPKLNYLNMANAKNVKTEQLKSLASQLPGLRTLIMCEGTIGSDFHTGFTAIVTKLVHLEVCAASFHEGPHSCSFSNAHFRAPLTLVLHMLRCWR